MKKIKYLLFILITIFSINMPIMAISNIIESFTVNHDIFIDNNYVNDLLERPIISYKDNTYIAVRDMAKIFDKNIFWDDRNNTITLSAKNIDKKKSIICNDDTAMMIGQTIIQQFFKDEVNENTSYKVGLAQPTYAGAVPIYMVYVTFNNDSDNKIVDSDYYDVEVKIASDTGKIVSVLKNEKGKLVDILE